MIFQRWFGRGREANSAITQALYERIVAAARQPVFYASWRVPDTPLGRFEMISLHMILFLHRVRGDGAAMADIAQALTEEFFAEVDSSVRELGVGDAGVPKRVKRLAKMFYGRAESYGAALDRADVELLASALARNVWPGSPDWEGAQPLARYALAAHQHLRAENGSQFLAGRITFPDAERIGG